VKWRGFKVRNYPDTEDGEFIRYTSLRGRTREPTRTLLDLRSPSMGDPAKRSAILKTRREKRGERSKKKRWALGNGGEACPRV